MEKLKIYLDTNMIHDLFTQQSDALKSGMKPEIPKKFTFMLDHQDRFKFITSFLTKAEIMRELVSAHNLDEQRVEQFWAEFMTALKPKYIQKFEFDDSIVNIVAKTKMKLRTMVNFFHLFIAIKEQAYFVSGDKQILEKIRETQIYDKLLSYIELQKLAASYTDPSSYGES